MKRLAAVFGITLAPVLFLLAIGLASFEPATAQPFKAWPNDQLGRPAPPCMLYNTATGNVEPCSATNGIPVNTGATGSTPTTTETGFGQQWYPGTVSGSVAAGEGMSAVFIGDNQVAFFRRSTGCANCLQVAVSTDGGYSATFVSTSAIIGNTLSTAHRVPSTTPRYLVSSIGGPLNIFQSTSLSSGWTAVTGIAASVNTFASNTAGTTVLSLSSNAGIQICRSTNGGVSFATCTTPSATGPASIAGQGLAFVSGTTWLAINNAGEIWRSTNDGVSFALAFTGGGNGRAVRCFPGTTTCVYTANDQNIYRSTDAGVTWTVVSSGVGTASGLCTTYGASAAGLLPSSPPVGLSTVEPNARSSFNTGASWFPGNINGSVWDGTGVPSIQSLDCQAGKGIATYATTGGGTNVFSLYNPTAGSVLTANAQIIAGPVQGGPVLLNSQTTGAAATPVPITLTGAAGLSVHIYSIDARCGTAADTATVTIAEAGVTRYSSAFTQVALVTQNSFSRVWSTAFTAQQGASVVVTLGACTAGAGTLIIQADRF